MPLLLLLGSVIAVVRVEAVVEEEMVRFVAVERT